MATTQDKNPSPEGHGSLIDTYLVFITIHLSLSEPNPGVEKKNVSILHFLPHNNSF